MSKNRAKRKQQQEHETALEKKRSLNLKLEDITKSEDNVLQAKIAEILAEEELIDIRPEGLVTKGKDGKIRVHFLAFQ
jgi:hypothetical protein